MLVKKDINNKYYRTHNIKTVSHEEPPYSHCHTRRLLWDTERGESRCLHFPRRRRLGHIRCERQPADVGLVVLLHGHGARHASLHTWRRQRSQQSLPLAEEQERLGHLGRLK